MTLSREDAWALVTEYTQSESLRKHMLAVEAAVRGYARLWGENEEDWGVVALLHDFDYERWPDQQNHPFRGVEILKAKGYPEWVTRAILSHADYSGVPRESRLEKTLYACDEMSGFVTAAALVRPSKSVLDLEAASVLKRMKDKAFARAVSRDDLQRGAEELGLPLEEHVANVINVPAGRGRTARAQGKPLTPESRITKDLETAATLPPIATPAADPAAPVVQLDGVTRHLRQESGAQERHGAVRPRRGRPARPERRGQEHDAEGAARVRQARSAARCRCSGSTSRERPLEIRVAHRLHAGERRAHSRA